MTPSPDFAPLDRSGECDQCHDPRSVLYGFADDEPGDWTYCERCARGIARRRRARRKAPTV